MYNIGVSCFNVRRNNFAPIHQDIGHTTTLTAHSLLYHMCILLRQTMSCCTCERTCTWRRNQSINQIYKYTSNISICQTHSKKNWAILIKATHTNPNSYEITFFHWRHALVLSEGHLLTVLSSSFFFFFPPLRRQPKKIKFVSGRLHIFSEHTFFRIENLPSRLTSPSILPTFFATTWIDYFKSRFPCVGHTVRHPLHVVDKKRKICVHEI